MPNFILKQIPNGPETTISGVVTVGRNDDNTLRLKETKVSRYHARLTLSESAVFVEDLKSSNGTFINNRRIEANKPVQLNSGDRLRFDHDEFEFRAPSKDASRTEVRATEVSARPPPWVDPQDNKTILITPPPKKRDAPKAPAAALLGDHAPGDAPYLFIATGSKAGSKFELPLTAEAKQSWTIGGQSDRNLTLADAGVSAMHATLRRDGPAWQLTDDLSVNGTFVNDAKILQCYLSDGDRIRFGPLECVFRIPPPTPKSRGAARGRNVALLVAGTFIVTLAVIFAVYKFISN